MNELRELRHLDLRENTFTQVPESLSSLPRLRQLDLRSNRINEVPDWVVQMPALEKLDLRWNTCTIPRRVLAGLENRGCVVLL
ncbi:leucine-rich repeat domain-containing protein [Streptomyces antimycoticus]